MDGAKLVTDTVDYNKIVMVGRRFVRAKACMRVYVNRSKLRILVKVRPEAE